MTGDYEILDILTQGPEGVCFLAEDRQRGKQVELLRFFPFGPDDSRLDEEDAKVFRAGLDRLIQLNVPKLRSVLDGGVDPHDGIPFLVVDAVGEASLAARLEHGPIGADAARVMAESALEVCLSLSKELGDDRVWIGTSAEMIGFEEGDSQPVVTFGLSPLRWLGQDAHLGGLYPLLELLEFAGGWHGRVVSSSMGNGFGRWLRDLRKNAPQWSLREARDALYQATRLAANPVPATGPVAATAQITSPLPTSSQPSSRQLWENPKKDRPMWPWLVAVSVVFVVGAILLYTIFSGANSDSKTDSAKQDQPLTAAEKANARAAELAAERAKTKLVPEVRPGPASREKNSELIELGAYLRGKTGQSFEFESTVHGVRQSNSGKTLYIEFGSTHDPNALLARHRVTNGGFTMDDLRAFKTQKIRVKGEVVVDPSGRIAIDVSGPSALTLVPD